jgi:hypothetical protein
MDITPNYHLILHPDQNHQLKPYDQENRVSRQNFKREPIAGHTRFRQSDSNRYTMQLEIQNHTYGVGQTLTYPNIDQVGLLIDIYA